MPVYEYECGACGHQFEEWQKISDAPIRTCPKCHKKKVERLISQTSFQLKGGGWYSDLYSSKKAAGAGDKGGDKGGGDKGGGDKGGGGGDTAKAKDSAPSGGSAKKDGGSAGTGTGAGKKKDGGSKAAPAST